MELKLIDVKDLEEEDEILISCQGYFKYLRVVRKPVISKNKHWNTGAPLYKSVKCSTNRSVTQKSWITLNNDPHYYNEYKWEFGPENHNTIQYIDLNSRQILLIKRKEQ